MSHTLRAAGNYIFHAATRPGDLPKESFLLKTEKDIPAEHTLSHRYVFDSFISAAASAARPHASSASPAQFVLLISHPCSNVMQCKENFFMIPRSYTTDYALVKRNMIIFLNYFSIFI